jgi:thiamine pyrophosphate-dependent acetolactate synthase large subunit-like protein
VEEAARLLLEARNPVLVVGPEVTRSAAVPAVIALAEGLAAAVTQGESLFADFPTDHPLFLGDYAASSRHPGEVDLVLNLGARMPAEHGVIPSGARVVHVSVDADLVGRVVPTDVGIVADVKEAATDLLTALRSLATEERLAAIVAPRLGLIRTHTDMVRAGQARALQARWDASPLSWERVAGELEHSLEKDAIVVSELTHKRWDAGWEWAADRASNLLEQHGVALPQLAFTHNGALSPLTFGPGAKHRIGKSTGGALGWGVGTALGVKLAQPDRQVVALQGDGSFMFGQAESLWTMARYEVPVIVVVFNNRSYNGPRNQIMIESETQRQSGKDMSCYLGDPDVDFAKVAAGFGVRGEVVTMPGEIRPALQRAIAATREGRPYLIDAVVARTGVAADSTWYPRYSVAAARTRKV